MSTDIRVDEHPGGVDAFDDRDEFVEIRIHPVKVTRREAVCFRPMWSTAMSTEDSFEPVKKFPRGHVQAIRSFVIRFSFFVLIRRSFGWLVWLVGFEYVWKERMIMRTRRRGWGGREIKRERGSRQR